MPTIAILEPGPPDFPDHIETRRLLIRAPRSGDGDTLYEAVRESLDHLKPWLPWAHDDITPEGEENTVRRMHARFVAREDLPFFLFLKGTSTLVGGSGLHRFDWDVPRFEIGYWVRKRFEGQGFISEAVAGISQFAFEHLLAERVEIRMDERNHRSYQVAERLGFTWEGTLRHNMRDVNGNLRNTRVYSMIRSEWQNRQRLQNKTK